MHYGIAIRKGINMKTNFKLGLALVLGLGVQALVQFTAFAGDYPMSGQDTVLKLK